ncbi:hypothetical protein BDV35DRAFT_138601 [Aspergillus flavus]|uniref:Arb2-like domain-containing protein n=1 Tax=Aspergillus flavus TaxID=5059 RepID=A0A5N6GCV9_ASPFL|nr:hypothetical protein BDV35DRAFT_138601 [Aspergillus flavus]
MPKRLRRGMLQGEYRNVKGINQNELTGNENCETRRSSGNIQDILGRIIVTSIRPIHPRVVDPKPALRHRTPLKTAQIPSWPPCPQQDLPKMSSICPLATRHSETTYPTESNTARELDNRIPGAPNALICSEFPEDNTMKPRNHSGSPAFDGETDPVLSTEHDSSGPDTMLVILSEMTDTAASQLKDFPGTKLAIAYTFPDSSESLSDAALKIASSSAQLIKNYTENAKNVFLCGLGYGSLVVSALLKKNLIAYAKVNGVICFIGDYVVPAVYDRKQLRHWYHMNSRVFVKPSHHIRSHPLRYCRRYGTLIAYQNDESFEEALVEASGFIRAWIAG